MRSRTSGLLRNLTLAAASVLVVLLVAELGLRLVGFSPPRFRDTARIYNGRRSLMLDCYPENPRGYFEIDLRQPATLEHYRRQGVARAAAVAERAPHAVEFRYNSLRYRDEEFAAPREGTRRVIVLGDSFTEGWGVKEADTYPKVLDRLLNDAEPGRWEVLNGGRRGADFPLLFTMFEELIAFEPDILIYGMVLNDADRSASFEARQPHLNDWILNQAQMKGGRPVPPMELLDSRLASFVEDRLETVQIGRASTRWYQEMYAEPNRDGWRRTQQHLKQMNQRLRAQGARLLLASWPLLVALDDQYPFDAAHETIERFCVLAGIPLHDLRPTLGERPTATLWVHPVDRHPNELAHRLAAESLAPVVRALIEE
jgi:lysophospholipase L1-like esterase